MTFVNARAFNDPIDSQGTGKRMIIDVNAATAEELDAVDGLQGHGFEIVRTREDRGRFTALRQLEEVPGLAGKIDGLEGKLSFG